MTSWMFTSGFQVIGQLNTVAVRNVEAVLSPCERYVEQPTLIIKSFASSVAWDELFLSRDNDNSLCGKTFGSVLAQNGISTAVTQKLLEHSSPDLTNKVYTNVDPVLRHAVDQIPAADWLRFCIVGKRRRNGTPQLRSMLTRKRTPQVPCKRGTK